MIVVALSFLAGILAIVLNSALWMNAMQVCIVAGLLLYSKHYWGLISLVVGLFWAVAATDLEQSSWPESRHNEQLSIVGQVDGLVKTGASGSRFMFRAKQGELKNKKLSLSTYKLDLLVHSGDHCQLRVKLKQPHGLANPGGFNYARWAKAQHIYATGTVVSGQCKHQNGFNLSAQRDQISQYLMLKLGDDQPTAILRALAVGDRRGISAQTWNTLSRTGLSHLLAISGLHIGLMAVFGFWLFGKINDVLGLRVSLYLKVSVALVFATIYAGMAGFSVPTQRALWMLVGVSVGILGRWNWNAYDYLGMALFCVLLVDPLSVLSAGFWMSFAATSILIVSFSGEQRDKGSVRQILKAQSSVFVGLMVPSLWIFGRASLFSPLINLLAIPFVSFLLVPVLMVGLVLALGDFFLAKPMLLLAHSFAEVLLKHSGQVANLPNLMLKGDIPAALFVLAGLGAMILITPFRNYLYAPAVVLITLPMLWRSQLDEGEFDIQVLDVGQGLSVVVKTRAHTLLFDTGMKFSSGSDIGQAVILPYLQYAGVDKIDQLLVSHGDADHSGGAKSILDSIAVTRFLSSDLTKFPNAERCHLGQKWQWDGVEFEILNPTEGMPYLGNDSSCVLRISSDLGSALIPGDISQAVEYRLTRLEPNKIQSELIIAPHHGSKTSSSIEFIKAVSPRYVVYSTGFVNRFFMPHKIIEQRYQQQNVQAFNTAYSGAVRFEFRADSLQVNVVRD
ncbi:MAG: DNA internalization-related competence protein ComEC/Rec2 [bacterium]